jgi:hypothetical protein
MPLLPRPDGTPVDGLHPLRVLMPHVMPTRTGSTVFFDQTLDLSRTLPWLSEQQAQGRRVTFFHLVLAGLVRTLHERPQLHRFVVGRRIYQRKHVELSFAVKKALRDDAALTTVKVRFEPGDQLDDVVRRVDGAIAQGKGQSATASEREMAATAWLPGPVLALLLALQRGLDAWNLLPWPMIRSDPLYASAFLANLGSIGLDAPYHHLYEYGTVPIFAALGRIQKLPFVDGDGNLAVRDSVVVRWSLDERVADGLYCARSLELFRAFVEEPARLQAAGSRLGTPSGSASMTG